MSSMGTDEPQLERTREAPDERFGGAEHQFDLAAEAASLRAEPRPGRDGHRVITLFRQDPVSLLLFDFEAGGAMADHVADGIVTIHVLTGRAEVRTAEAQHEIPAGSVLVMRPGVRHDLVAPVAAEVLVTIHLGA